jgi:hypothetical protein
MKVGRTARLLVLCLCLAALPFCFSARPLWQFAWRQGLYTITSFTAEKTASGGKVAGGAWRTSKRIRVYGMPDASPRVVAEAHAGMKSLVDELGLDIAVELAEAPPDAVAAYRDAQVSPGGDAVDFDRFAALRLDQRGATYGEMVVFDGHFSDPAWAWGISSFRPGLAMLTETHSDANLGRHEGAHLIGYNKHDDFPWYVLGYREKSSPAARDTLMMLLPTGADALSDRARDALLNFWRGLERRDNTRYFR